MTPDAIRALPLRLRRAATLFDLHPSEVYAANWLCREAADALDAYATIVEWALAHQDEQYATGNQIEYQRGYAAAACKVLSLLNAPRGAT